MPTLLSARPRWTALLPAAALLLGSVAVASPSVAQEVEDGEPTPGSIASELFGFADADDSEVTLGADVYVETEDPALGAGTVTFSEGPKVLGTVAVAAETDTTDGEVASLVVRSVEAGSHQYTITFTPGSASVQPSSDTVSVRVAAGTSGTTKTRSNGSKADRRLSLSLKAPASVRRGGRATVVATLTSAAGPAPTGTVVATAGGRSYRAALRSGTATFKIPVSRRTKVVVKYAGPPVVRKAVLIAVAKQGR